MNGIAVETAVDNGTIPGAGLSKLVPIALNRLPYKPSVSVLITCFNYGPTLAGQSTAHSSRPTRRQRSSSATMAPRTTRVRS